MRAKRGGRQNVYVRQTYQDNYLRVLSRSHLKQILYSRRFQKDLFKGSRWNLAETFIVSNIITVTQVAQVLLSFSSAVLLSKFSVDGGARLNDNRVSFNRCGWFGFHILLLPILAEDKQLKRKQRVPVFFRLVTLRGPRTVSKYHPAITSLQRFN